MRTRQRVISGLATVVVGGCIIASCAEHFGMPGIGTVIGRLPYATVQRHDALPDYQQLLKGAGTYLETHPGERARSSAAYSSFIDTVVRLDAPPVLSDEQKAELALACVDTLETKYYGRILDSMVKAAGRELYQSGKDVGQSLERWLTEQ